MYSHNVNPMKDPNNPATVEVHTGAKRKGYLNGQVRELKKLDNPELE